MPVDSLRRADGSFTRIARRQEVARPVGGRGIGGAQDVEQHVVGFTPAQGFGRALGVGAPAGQPLANVVGQFAVRAAHVDADAVQIGLVHGRAVGRLQGQLQ
ncbi:hypothetical protein D3C71_1899600 [compost metagenome]